jgi:hypothetical protein
LTKKSTYTLFVPERFSDNFGDPFKRILEILPEINKDWDEIIVDFKDSKFLVPHYLGPLSCILKLKDTQGTKITLINNSSYLQTIQFPFGVDFNINNATSLDYYHGKTFIPIIHFPTAHTLNEATLREQILTTMNSLLKQQLQLPVNVLMGFYYLIDELTQNIVDHSGVSFGTVFAQFYREKNYMDISICDCGKGIFQTYLESGKHLPKSNSEAINFGVYGKSTKNIPESRGFGLNTSRTMLTKGLNGKFLMMTLNDFFIQTSEREEIISLDQKTSFKGCMLNLRVPIFKLDEFTINSYTDL